MAPIFSAIPAAISLGRLILRRRGNSRRRRRRRFFGDEMRQPSKRFDLETNDEEINAVELNDADVNDPQPFIRLIPTAISVARLAFRRRSRRRRRRGWRRDEMQNSKRFDMA